VEGAPPMQPPECNELVASVRGVLKKHRIFVVAFIDMAHTTHGQYVHKNPSTSHLCLVIVEGDSITKH